jgi:hypothetical protein
VVRTTTGRSQNRRVVAPCDKIRGDDKIRGEYGEARVAVEGRRMHWAGMDGRPVRLVLVAIALGFFGAWSQDHVDWDIAGLVVGGFAGLLLGVGVVGWIAENHDEPPER